MSIFSWLGRKRAGQAEAQGAPAAPQPPEPPDGAPAREPSASDPLARIRSFGAPNGPTEPQLLELLSQAAGTPREREAIAAVASLTVQQLVPDRIRSACACMLVERGERDSALKLLEPVQTPEAMMLRADLLYESGAGAQALSLVERLLAHDIDFLGARERHERWREHLGLRPPARRSNADATIAVPVQTRAPFRVLREVARGGSGTIYEAQDEALRRTIAFKVYHRTDSREQASREARFAARFAGPGVVRVFDADFDQGWLALEWLALGSMRDQLASGGAADLAPFDRWAPALAFALARVHDAGFVHADIKPANILLRSTREPLLSDFGICVAEGSESLGGSSGYLSPERLSQRALQRSDDVYGFGRILDDVLAKAPAGPNTHQWRVLADQCMQPDPLRPQNAGQLLGLIATPSDSPLAVTL